MPVSQDMDILQVLPGTGFSYPVKAGTRIFGRALIGLTAEGFAAPLSEASVAFVGIARNRVDNRGGVDGDEIVSVERDCRAVPVDVKAEDIGKEFYAADDDITQITSTAGGKRIGVLVGQTSGRQGKLAVINLMI